jgi:exopolysaccharide biosynthesis predicted pyruvyltransferase EpsI
MQVAITQIAFSRVAGGAEQISKGRVIITNRLHATIMANFVGRPVIWIDTKQKKVNGEWTLTLLLCASHCHQRFSDHFLVMYDKPIGTTGN